MPEPSSADPWRACFPEAEAVVQTHVSRVFLGPDRVYKVKKPVDFGFLDFRTLEARRAACEAEVRLGRRLAPDVYRGVVPIVRAASGRLVRGEAGQGTGAGEVVDAAVEMVRLPDADRADVRLGEGRFGPAEVDAVAAVLVDFYAGARRTPAYGDPRFVRRNVEENFDQTAGTMGDFLDAGEADRLRRALRSGLSEVESLLAERARCGRAVEGHGDLRLEHVYLDGAGTVRILDAIEFNARFRCGDVAGDVAFLSMDLVYRNRADLAERLLARIAEGLGDFGIYRLVDFFEAYRAHVRAKIETFVRDDPGVAPRRREEAARRARRYYRLAAAMGRPSLAPPFLLAVTGGIGVGKSTLARVVADRYAAPVVGTDAARKQLLGVTPTTPLHDAPHRGAYDPLVTDVVYDAVCERAEHVLASGRPVVVDGTFGTPARRAALRRLAGRYGVRFLLVFGTLDPGERLRRLRARARGPSVSDGREAIVADLDAAFVPPDELSPRERLDVDLGGPVEGCADRVVASLGIAPLEGPTP